MMPRRRFLALAATPATLVVISDRAAARHVDHTALPRVPQDCVPVADPQVQRMRAIEIDDTVEPALVFFPGGK